MQNSVPILVIFIISIALVLVIYGLLYYLGHRQNETLDALDERRQAIENSRVQDKIYKLKIKHVSGSTEQQLETQQADWENVKHYNLSAIEAVLISAQAKTEKFRFIQARRLIDQVETKLEETEKIVSRIHHALSALIALEQENEQRYEATHKRYADIRKQLSVHGYQYGESTDMLQDHLSSIELDLTKYHVQMNSGDYIEAESVLTQIDADIDDLETMMEQIPGLLKRIQGEYREQLDDLKQGYNRLRADDFQYPDHIDVGEEIDKCTETTQSAYDAVIKGDLDEARNFMRAAEVQIDHTYQIMQDELDARQYVEKTAPMLQRELEQLQRDNHYSVLEVDRVSQNYLLHDNEKGRMSDFSDEIAAEQQRFDRANEQLGTRTIAYSEVQKQYEDSFEKLAMIRDGQAHLLGTLSQLRGREQKIRDDIYSGNLALRNMQRVIEAHNLPGLTDEYLDHYFDAGDVLTEAQQKLNRVRLDIRAIETLMTDLNQRITDLKTETERTIDAAVLTENTIQYANRYRNDYPAVNQAIREADDLFNEQFDYEKAHQTIAEALDQVEPGASRQVKRWYDEEKRQQDY